MPTTRWPNFCPYCGTRESRGGAASRHGVPNCQNCHADYDVIYHGTYPASNQDECDKLYLRNGGFIPKQDETV